MKAALLDRPGASVVIGPPDIVTNGSLTVIFVRLTLPMFLTVKL